MEKLQLNLDMPQSNNVKEAYKVVRSNLLFCGADVKSVVFTSALESEGKSTITWNLSMSIADSGKKVLYIDADMRKSVFAGRNQVRSQTVGLSHFLSGQAEINDIVYATEKENLYVMMAGTFPPNPSELLGQDLFKKMMDVLKQTFDYIIIDAPPVLAAIDAAVIASACDGAVLVVGANKASRKLVQESVAQLKKSGATILGSILNMYDGGLLSGKYYGYYGKYYGKYSYGKEND